MTDAPLSPDEMCLVCETTRENHGDKNHVFNPVSDNLVPLKPGPPARREAPRERASLGAPQPGPSPEARAFATLVEILSEKTISFDGVNRPILDSKDIIRIFSGQG
jgi:hypothetical protein